MGTYGRNFDFRIPPISENRAGRFSVPATGKIPIGVPVIGDTTAGFDALDNQIVKLAGHQAAPVGGFSGVAVYEYGPAAYAGFDPFLTTYSDLDFVPVGKALQVVSGPYVKILLTNTTAQTFLGVRNYAGRIMVNGFGATTTVTEGDYLVPGLGNDTDGYWESQSSSSGAWAVITKVDTTRVTVEARLLF